MKNVQVNTDGLQFDNANGTHTNVNTTATADTYINLPSTSGTLALTSALPTVGSGVPTADTFTRLYWYPSANTATAVSFKLRYNGTDSDTITLTAGVKPDYTVILPIIRAILPEGTPIRQINFNAPLTGAFEFSFAYSEPAGFTGYVMTAVNVQFTGGSPTWLTDHFNGNPRTLGNASSYSNPSFIVRDNAATNATVYLVTDTADNYDESGDTYQVLIDAGDGARKVYSITATGV